MEEMEERVHVQISFIGWPKRNTLEEALEADYDTVRRMIIIPSGIDTPLEYRATPAP